MIPVMQHVCRACGGTFWYPRPLLPIFPIVPALPRHGVGGRLRFAAGCDVMMLLYCATIPVAARSGVTL